MQHNVQIIPIPAFKDNYIWLLHDNIHAVVIDPGDASPVISALQRQALSLQAILITHHHHDHIEGVTPLCEVFPNTKVYAPQSGQYDFHHIPVSEPDTIKLPELKLAFTVIDLPGHTLDHIAYYAEYASEKVLFCGDTLFGAGCGRLFEGTPLQMYSSLQKLAKLPAETRVYPAHEYTLTNIEFAITLEPDNPILRRRHQEVMALQKQQLASLPSSIALELATNPFLRCNRPEVRSATRHSNTVSPVHIFSTLREMRNHY